MKNKQSSVINLQSTILNHHSKGYTLIEVIVAVQIFLIVLTMLYTIYLFGYKFMLKWNNDNDLIATELLIQKSLRNELTSAKGIIEISENEIIYKDKNYNLQKITWDNDSLIIKNKRVNKSEIKITIQNIKFLQNSAGTNQSSTFEELDINSDNKINNAELEKTTYILFEYLLSNRKNSIHSQIELQVIKSN